MQPYKLIANNSYTIQAIEIPQGRFAPDFLKMLMGEFANPAPAAPLTSNLFITTPGPQNPGGYPGLSVQTALGAAISAITNANPIVVTTGTTIHNFKLGDIVNISGVTGNTNANGTFVISSVSGFTFTIPAAGNGVSSFGSAIITKYPYWGQYLVKYISSNWSSLQNTFDVFTAATMATYQFGP